MQCDAVLVGDGKEAQVRGRGARDDGVRSCADDSCLAKETFSQLGERTSGETCARQWRRGTNQYYKDASHFERLIVRGSGPTFPRPGSAKAGVGDVLALVDVPKTRGSVGRACQDKAARLVHGNTRHSPIFAGMAHVHDVSGLVERLQPYVSIPTRGRY